MTAIKNFLLLFLVLSCSLAAVTVDAGYELLYLKPQHCPFVLGGRNDTTSIPGTTIQTFYPMGTHYHWAQRVRLQADKDCYGALFRYLWFKSNDPARREGGQLFAPLFTSTGNLITGNIRFDYQNLDVRLLRSFTTRFCDSIDLFINGRWLDLTRIQLILLFNDNAFVSQEKRLESFRGGAVGIGTRFNFGLWRWFSGFITINPMAAVGERKDMSNSNGPFPPFSLLLKLQPSTVLLPACDGQIGLKASWKLASFCVEGQVGYEINYYWNAFSGEILHIAGFDQTRAAMNGDATGFAGIFFGAQARY